MKIEISEHAWFEAGRRNISKTEIIEAVEYPDQIVESRKNRIIYQSLLTEKESNKRVLLRVVSSLYRDSCRVITVYKTTKINKYWKKDA